MNSLVGFLSLSVLACPSALCCARHSLVLLKLPSSHLCHVFCVSDFTHDAELYLRSNSPGFSSHPSIHPSALGNISTTLVSVREREQMTASAADRHKSESKHLGWWDRSIIPLGPPHSASLHRLPLHFRLYFKILWFVFKCSCPTLPAWAAPSLRSARCLRATDERLLKW